MLLGFLFFFGLGGGGWFGIYYKSFKPHIEIVVVVVVVVVVAVVVIGFEYWIDSCTFENQVIALL